MGDPVAICIADTEREKLLVFWCPACDEVHQIRVRGGEPCWGWNQNLERPSFTPSYKLTRRGDPQSTNAKYREAVVCHSFVTDGRIAYCHDSTHALAGLTVALPPLPEPWRSLKPRSTREASPDAPATPDASAPPAGAA